MTEYQASERRGCRIMGISRSLLHYCPNTARIYRLLRYYKNWHINIRHMALVLCSIS
nr:lcrT [Yersinia pseudotuberculosis]